MTPQRFIGDMPVSALGLGAASWSVTDVTGRLEGEPIARVEELGARAIHAALEAGITLIDTARAYTTATHPGHSEALVRRVLSERPERSRIVVATKGGRYRNGSEFPIDARPEAIRRDCELSRELLGVDCIDLYQLHWPDPAVPLRATMSAFAALREEGWIRHIGVSNLSLAQLEEAMTVAPIASVQNCFSPLVQDDRAVVDFCAERGIAYLAYSPLGGSLPDGTAMRLDEAFPAAAAVAARKGISIQRLALAWLLTVSPTLIPICGAGRPETIRDSALAADLELTEDELAALDFASRTDAAADHMERQNG